MLPAEIVGGADVAVLAPAAERTGSGLEVRLHPNLVDQFDRLPAQILELFEDIFSRDERFELKTAATGYDAGMLTESFRPQLIILDYMLPDVNGNVVCERIRGNDEFRDTRILFVSGVVNQAEIDALLSAGGDGFLKKPFNISTLMAEVERLLGLETQNSRSTNNVG